MGRTANAMFQACVSVGTRDTELPPFMLAAEAENDNNNKKFTAQGAAQSGQ